MSVKCELFFSILFGRGDSYTTHADAYFTKTVKFGQISKISVVLECLQQLQQNFSEVQPLYEFCNVILSKNFYFKKT